MVQPFAQPAPTTATDLRGPAHSERLANPRPLRLLPLDGAGQAHFLAVLMVLTDES